MLATTVLATTVLATTVLATTVLATAVLATIVFVAGSTVWGRMGRTPTVIASAVPMVVVHVSSVPRMVVGDVPGFTTDVVIGLSYIGVIDRAAPVVGVHRRVVDVGVGGIDGGLAAKHQRSNGKNCRGGEEDLGEHPGDGLELFRAVHSS